VPVTVVGSLARGQARHPRRAAPRGPRGPRRAAQQRDALALGTSWGALLGRAAAGRRPRTGIAFGLTVWGASLVELPALGLTPPVWEWDPKTLAPDVGFHLVYGVTAATAYKLLDG
jgi:hypothetical protein